MGLKWSVLIYLRLARKREMESRNREEGTIGFEVTADSAGRDSRYRRVKNRCEFVADFTGNLR